MSESMKDKPIADEQIQSEWEETASEATRTSEVSSADKAATAPTPGDQDRTASASPSEDAASEQDEDSQEIVAPTTSDGFYTAVGPRDGFEAMLTRSAITIHHLSIESASRALKEEALPVREKHFKIAIEANATLMKLSKAMDDHRRSQQPRRLIQQFSIKQ